MEQRPLCEAENNTCTNLAEIKMKIEDKIRYRRLCFKHRRSGRSVEKLRPGSKRFTPLGGCEMCVLVPATERHRIVQGGDYNERNVIELCQSCHGRIHRFYARLKASEFVIA